MSSLRQSAIRSNLILRARVLYLIRRFFEGRGFLEVDTPLVIPAPAPEVHIDAQAVGRGYLQTSPELCMKRLLAAGHPRIFQICKCFRRKERGRRHLPEFTILEWYFAQGTYLQMMDQTEALIQAVAAGVGAFRGLAFRGRIVDMAGIWPRITVDGAFERYASMTADEALAGDCFDEIMVNEVEPNLGWPQPVFLYDYPAACGSLAQLKRPDLLLAERFELYIAGIELCNAFTELTDPEDHRTRFEQALTIRGRMGKPVSPMPEAFLASLAQMPAATGNALGVDRLVMLFADTDEIDDVVAFVPEEL